MTSEENLNNHQLSSQKKTSMPSWLQIPQSMQADLMPRIQSGSGRLMQPIETSEIIELARGLTTETATERVKVNTIMRFSTNKLVSSSLILTNLKKFLMYELGKVQVKNKITDPDYINDLVIELFETYQNWSIEDFLVFFKRVAKLDFGEIYQTLDYPTILNQAIEHENSRLHVFDRKNSQLKQNTDTSNALMVEKLQLKLEKPEPTEKPVKTEFTKKEELQRARAEFARKKLLEKGKN